MQCGLALDQYCLTGRACLYGQAAQGREEVACALTLFKDELRDCMALTGLTSARPPGVVTAQPALR
jgi:L-lactate dehydrogenase (cytochrome)